MAKSNTKASKAPKAKITKAAAKAKLRQPQKTHTNIEMRRAQDWANMRRAQARIVAAIKQGGAASVRDTNIISAYNALYGTRYPTPQPGKLRTKAPKGSHARPLDEVAKDKAARAILDKVMAMPADEPKPEAKAKGVLAQKIPAKDRAKGTKNPLLVYNKLIKDGLTKEAAHKIAYGKQEPKTAKPEAEPTPAMAKAVAEAASIVAAKHAATKGMAVSIGIKRLELTKSSVIAVVVDGNLLLLNGHDTIILRGDDAKSLAWWLQSDYSKGGK